jgi:hypothetical protein
LYGYLNSDSSLKYRAVRGWGEGVVIIIIMIIISLIFSAPVQTGPGAHLAFLYKGYRVMELTTNTHLAPKLKKE